MPFAFNDSQLSVIVAGQRLLRRAVANLGVRFADYLVVDGGFATAPFLHAAGEVGLPVVARLKENLPELLATAQKRFHSQASHLSFQNGKDRVEIWDADDFDPWETLRWETVRVFMYRQHSPMGKSSKPSGSPISKLQKWVAAPFFRLPKADGRSRTRVSTMPKIATAWSISAIIIPTACSSAGS